MNHQSSSERESFFLFFGICTLATLIHKWSVRAFISTPSNRSTDSDITLLESSKLVRSCSRRVVAHSMQSLFYERISLSTLHSNAHVSWGAVVSLQNSSATPSSSSLSSFSSSSMWFLFFCRSQNITFFPTLKQQQILKDLLFIASFRL